MTVDGTDFRIQCPKGRKKYYWSHKFRTAGLRYEVTISIARGEIVSVNGPHPASIHDVTIFRAGLKKRLKFGEERVEADQGYQGEYHFVDLPDQGCFHNPGHIAPCPGCEQRKLKSRISATEA